MDAKVAKKILETVIRTAGSEIFPLCWSLESCNPDRRVDWKPGSPIGQADVTALIVRDLLGGDIMETRVNGALHYYSRLKDGTRIDLTERQYSVMSPIPPGQVYHDPDDLFVGPEAVRLETSMRYAELSDAVFHALHAFVTYAQKHTDLGQFLP